MIDFSSEQGSRRVLVLYPSGYRGGSLSVVEDLARAMADVGVEVHLAFVGPAEIRVRGPGRGRETRIPVRRPAFVSQLLAVIRYARARHINVIHSHLTTYPIAALSARVVGVPSVRTVHGRLTRPGMLSWSERLKFRAAVRLLSLHVVAVSQEVASDLAAFYGFRTGADVAIIPNGYSVAGARKTDVLGSAGEFWFAFVGAIESSKGFPLLYDAWLTVHEMHPHTRLLVIGDGAEKERVDRSLIDAGDLELSAGWVPREQVRELLGRRQGALVLPSYSEGTSLALLEAMALGYVPIVSDAANGDRIVTDGVNGWTFPTGSRDGLVRCMVKAVRSGSALRVLGNRARETVESRFSLEEAARAHLRLYASLGPRTRGPS